jgi:hypothetical protein
MDGVMRFRSVERGRVFLELRGRDKKARHGFEK